MTSTDYDHVGRVLQTRHKVNAQAEVILSKNQYNEIGQLKTKSLHSANAGSSFLTSNSYTYNERGWTTKASSAQFTYQLNYNSGATPQYNGNISQQLWGHAASTGNTFTYNYDKLNRLTKGSSSGVIMYERMEYDDMGNITKLTRNSQTAADTLAINYNYLVGSVKSNRLQSLTGGFTGTYTYDANGNATKDRTGMNISYNHLNLSKTATKTGVSVSYLYDAMGVKLRKIGVENSITTISDYVEGIEYSKVGAAVAAIDRIATSEGYLMPSSGTYIYHYNLTDHLGNVRSVFKATSATVLEVVQKSDYYPFGKRHANSSYVYNDNRYLYNGKELQDELRGGVNSFGGSYIQEGNYDYGARFYDAEIGRWNVPDPLAEQMSSWSPYNYTFNNPIKFIDPDGTVPDITIYGENNSSVTLKTDLIDISVNASSLGVDFGGNYTLDGEAVVSAGLDIVGIVDPSGIADGLNASLQAKNGDWLGAGISALGVIPYVGDVAKVGKIGKDVKIINNAIDEVKSAKQLLNEGRSGKQEKLRELINDPKLGKAEKGWLKQEKNAMDAGKRTTMRNPPGKDLAHERGREAAKGYSYKHSKLNNKADHKTQHKYDNNGKKNKERPIN